MYETKLNVIMQEIFLFSAFHINVPLSNNFMMSCNNLY